MQLLRQISRIILCCSGWNHLSETTTVCAALTEQRQAQEEREFFNEETKENTGSHPFHTWHALLQQRDTQSTKGLPK